MFTTMSQENEVGFFDILNLRSEWEELARHLNTDMDSSIQGLKSFVEHSHKNNRFKSGWEEAMDIAETILRNAK